MTKRYLVLLMWLAAGHPSRVLAQRVGPEFQVNTYTTEFQGVPSVASDASGNFVVVWQDGLYREDGQDGSLSGLFGQRYDNEGNRLGGEFQVNTYTTGEQHYRSIASDAEGNFVVVWASDGQDGSGDGIFGQRFATDGSPLGGEFQVNTHTTGAQALSSIASDPAGNFVVVVKRRRGRRCPRIGPKVPQRWTSSGQ